MGIFKSWVFVAFTGVLLSASCTKRNDAASTQTDDVFRNSILADLPGFNFFIDNVADQTAILSDVYESLLTRDPETYALIPNIAKSWTVAPDGMSFTFEIDEKAKWWDGTPITSEDVAFTLETMLGNELNSGVMKSVYGSLKNQIKIIDAQKFTIFARTKHFKNLDLASGFRLVPKHALKGKDLAKGPMLSGTIGSGPYMLEEWRQGDRVILAKNPNYWGSHLKHNQGAHLFSKKVYRIVREPKVGIELLKEGFFSVFAFTAEQWERDAKHERIQSQYDTYDFVNKVDIQTGGPKGYTFIGWNNALPVFSSIKTRLALAHLVNRDFMIENFTYGHAIKAIGPIASTSDYAPKDVKPIPFDPKTAVDLLTQDGWKDSNNDGVLDKAGKKLEFTLMFANPDNEKYLTVYKEDLQKVGIICNLKKVDWTTFVKLLDDRKYEAVILGWTANIDPDLYQIWHSDSIKNKGSNFMSYRNAKVDEMIVQARGEFDRSKRILLNQEISRIIAADAPYAFFLERPKSFVAARKGLKRPKDFYNYTLGDAYWIPSGSSLTQ